MKRIKCPKCNRLLIKVKEMKGDIKCHNCKNQIKVIVDDKTEEVVMEELK